MKRALLHAFALMLLSLISIPGVCQSQSQTADVIVVDGAAPAHDFNHFWEEMFGSGRAVLALRDSYRRDLRQVKEVTNLQYIRFHGIFHDEVGVYSENEQGQPAYNFSYVDQIYDGLLAAGVKPFVELSFMPKALAARDMPHAFWYKPNISPPKDWGKWDALIAELAKHLVARYGIDEVSNWYFEVWNEPNLDFWGGDPKQSTYWELYDHTAKALKGVSSRLRVGGPATAQAAWADAFIAHCAADKVPVDFVSSHVYGNDKAEDVFGTHEEIPRDRMVCRAVKKVHEQIKASAMPNLPLIWSEFNASYFNETDITDSSYMGPWMADTIRQCDGLVDMMSYWTFSDVFEEQGVVKTPFYGGFGLIAADDIPKPSFEVFKLLHQLGNQRIALDSDSALLTRRKDGAVVLALWNYALPAQGSARTVTLALKNLKTKHVTISRVDKDHGDYHAAYEKMGSPRYPTAAQIETLRQASGLGDREKVSVKNDRLSVTLPAQGLALVEFGR